MNEEPWRTSPDMHFFCGTDTKRWTLIPTISMGLAECPYCECGETTVVIAVEWLCFAAGVAIPNN